MHQVGLIRPIGCVCLDPNPASRGHRFDRSVLVFLPGKTKSSVSACCVWLELTSRSYDDLSQVVSVKREIKGECYSLWKRKKGQTAFVRRITPVNVLDLPLLSDACWTGCRGFVLGSCAESSDPPRVPQSDHLLDQNPAICSTSESPPERKKWRFSNEYSHQNLYASISPFTVGCIILHTCPTLHANAFNECFALFFFFFSNSAWFWLSLWWWIRANLTLLADGRMDLLRKVKKEIKFFYLQKN